MWTTCALIWAAAASAVSAEFIPYSNDVIYPLRPAYLTIPKFSPSVVPDWKPGRGRNVIDLTHVSAQLSCDSSSSQGGKCGPSKLEVAMFEAPAAGSKSWMERWPNGEFCCTQSLVNQGDCSQEGLGSLIVPRDIPNMYKRSISVTAAEPTPLTDDLRMDVKETGLYVIIMAVCREDAAPVELVGTIESMNPYGYLPADLFYDIPFYAAVTLGYTLIGIAWLITCSIYSEELLQLQLWITLVLFLGMVESTILYYHFEHWNDHGFMSLGTVISGVVFGVLKRTLSRVVVLMVSLGYGVVRPTLGDDMTKIMYLGSGYFIFSLIYSLSMNIPSNSKFVGDPEFENMIASVVLLLAAIDSTFYMWILKSLNSIVVALDTRKQTEKATLYKKFRMVLFVSLAFSVIWATYSSILLNGSNYEANWTIRWTVDALWEVLYLVVFVAICVLWAPSKNNQRYAYSALEMTDLSEGDGASASGSGSSGNSGSQGRVFTPQEEERIREATMARLDAEYGGHGIRDRDDTDPFLLSGALDADMAIVKKA